MGSPTRPLPPPLSGDAPALCLCLTQARTPDIVLVARAAGFDAIYVDLEHGVTPLDVTSMLCTTALGADLVPFVRVPSLDPSIITRVLDGGAAGIIVPHIDTPEQAQVVVDACRFPPVGRRSLYGMSPLTGYESGEPDETTARLEQAVVVAPMIESARAVEHAEKIASIDGVDMLLVGVHDLSADLGIAGQTTHPDVRAAVRAVGEACTATGRALGVAGVTDPDHLAELSELDVRFVTAGTDVGLLAAAATQRAASYRSHLDPS